jgi:hypothetical protein
VDEGRNGQHLFVEMVMWVDQMEVQENFLVYLYFLMLMNNKMKMTELEHHYHAMMVLLYDIIRLVIDEERLVLVILFVSR